MHGTEPAPPPTALPTAGPRWRSLGLAARIVYVRLRFLVVLVVAFVVVGKWDVLRNYWDALTRASGGDAASAVSQDTEYFCPMCPGVLSDWPGKCPVCNMALVRRKKDEPVPLPDGVVARMQFSPYRVQLAGIRTTPLEYRALVYEIVTAGIVEAGGPPGAAATPSRGFVKADVFERDVPLITVGRRVVVSSEAFAGRAPFEGAVLKLSPHLTAGTHTLQLLLEVEDPRQELRPGMLVTARIQVPATHVDWLARVVADDWRQRTAADLLAHALLTPTGSAPETGLEPLLMAAGRQVLFHRGLALALPESAVVDTGTQKVVYVETGPGMFDGIEVVLGPRCGEFYPVVRGVEAGQRVATAGAFLIDAETRLNPGVAASYFGAARSSGSAPAPASPATSAGLSRLSAADQALAAQQKLCPVTDEPLGSMGMPHRVDLDGKTVFLCCKACEPELRKNPGKYLPKLRGK